MSFSKTKQHETSALTNSSRNHLAKGWLEQCRVIYSQFPRTNLLIADIGNDTLEEVGMAGNGQS